MGRQRPTDKQKEAQLARLAAKAQAGDKSALHDLLTWAMDYLFPAVMGLLHESRRQGTYITETLHTSGPDVLERMQDDAWEIIHAACCRMTLRIDTFRGRNAFGRPVQFSTWVYAIARNEMRTLLRRRWRQWGRYGGSKDDDPAPLTAGAESQIGPSPEGTVSERLDIELVREALQNAPLTPEQREAVVLFHGYGYRQEQIAKMTGVKVGTVKKRVFDGLRKLRDYMEERSPGSTNRLGREA